MSNDDLELVEDFLAERNYSKSTDYNYRYLLRRFFTWLHDSGHEHQTVTVRQVKDWITASGWKNSLAYQTSVAIRGFSVWRLGEACPLSRLRIKAEDAGEQRTLNAAEVASLWTYLDKPVPATNNRKETCSIRDIAIISLALDTGLRASELCRLTLDRLSIEKQSLQVFAKGRKWRKCVFSHATADRLLKWLSIRPTLADPENLFVFCAIQGKTPGKQMTRYGIAVLLKVLSKKTGIYITPHSLRRTFATLAIRQGASTRLVQVQGGWSDIRMVEHYTQALTPDDFAGYFPAEIVNPNIRQSGKVIYD